jgi:hypothetical protein
MTCTASPTATARKPPANVPTVTRNTEVSAMLIKLKPNSSTSSSPAKRNIALVCSNAQSMKITMAERATHGCRRSPASTLSN